MKEVKNSIYVETSYPGANIGLIATDGGAVLVDSPMIPGDAWRWLRRVAKIAKGGLAYLINTDYHGAHVLGNCFFPAIIIGHELAWREVKSHGDNILQRYVDEYREKDPQIATELAEVRMVAPEVTVIDGLSLYKGNHHLDILFFGGHSQASIGVYLPEEKVLFTGDVVVNGRHPNLSQAQSTQWLQALERIRSLDVEIIVPGHGEPGDLGMVEGMQNYIQELRQRVENLYRNGSSRRETVEKVRTAMIERFPIRTERRDSTAAQIRSGIERIYEEVRKNQ